MKINSIQYMGNNKVLDVFSINLTNKMDIIINLLLSIQK